MLTWNWICIIVEQVEGASERLSPTKAPASDFTPIRQMTALTTPRYLKELFFKPMSCRADIGRGRCSTEVRKGELFAKYLKTPSI